MKRILGFALAAATGALAAAAAGRRLRRPATDPVVPPVDPRAEELRRKLAEARESAAGSVALEAEEPGGEPLVEERPTREDNPVVAPADDVDEARRRIHDEGRAAAEDMRRGGSDSD